MLVATASNSMLDTDFLSKWADSAIFTVSLYILIILLSILSLWSPPFRGRGIIFSTLIATLLYVAQNNSFPRGTSTRFSTGLLWYVYLGTIEKILFTTPEKAYWRLSKPREEAMAMAGFSLEKLRWALTLMASMRGVGWNFQVKGVPVGIPNETRWKFLLRQGRDLVFGCLALDFCSAIIRAHRYPPGADPDDLRISISARALVILATGIQSYFANSFNYQYLSIFAVAAGINKLKDWPPLFGRLSETTTIRRFWGSFWHQGIRKILSGYTQSLLRLLRVRHNTTHSSILTLLFTFLLSGLYHGYASYALTYPTPTSPYATTYDRFWRFMIFFMVQPIGIVIEDLVIKAYRSYTIGNQKQNGSDQKEKLDERWQTLLGYCWVLTWMMLSGNILVDAYLKTEMGLVGPSPIISTELIGLAFEKGMYSHDDFDVGVRI